jgi:uncharacterized protein YndB with AHSA1/START domain
MSTPQRPIAHVTHDFSVPAETVFDAWLDPELIRQWMGSAVAEAAGGDMRRVEVDARVGGSFTFSDLRDGEEAVHHGTYLEIDRPRRLVFTWMPEPGEHSLVTVDITPTSQGCTLALAHEMEPTWAEYLDRTTAGWTTMVAHIAKTVG